MKWFVKGGILALLCLSMAVAQVQPQDAGNGAEAGEEPLGALRQGLRIYNVAVFGNYFSNGLPNNFGPTFTSLPSDIAYGGSAAMGWLKTGSHVTATVQYSPSYSGRMRYSDLHSFGHNLNSNFSFRVSSKWSVNFNASAMITDLPRVLFGSSQAGQIAGTPATFNGLSSALVSGATTNPQLGAIISSPVANSPVAPILYGTRYLTAGSTLSVNYSRSERFQLSIGANGLRTQPLSQSTQAFGNTAILTRTMNAGAHVNVSYGLTPRLTLSGNWTGQRNFQFQQGNNLYGNTFIQTGRGSLGYLAGSRWLFTVGGGVGVLPSANRTPTNATNPRRLHYITDGSVAYKLLSQTFVATASRTVTNSYGVGATVTTNAQLGWRWNRPGSGWAFAADGGYQDLGSPVGASTNLTGWRGTASVHRTLTHHLSMVTDYSVLRTTGLFNNVNYGLTRNAARIMLVWSFGNMMGAYNDQNF
jgi:hypothetical protein